MAQPPKEDREAIAAYLKMVPAHQQQAVRDGGVITASGAVPVTFAREILDAIGLGSPELFEYLGMYGDEHRNG